MPKSMRPAHSRRSDSAEADRRPACRKTGQECSLGSVTGSSCPLQGQLCEVRMTRAAPRGESLLCIARHLGVGSESQSGHVPTSACLAPASSGLLAGSLPALVSLPPVLEPSCLRVTPEPMSSRPAQNSPSLFAHSSHIPSPQTS